MPDFNRVLHCAAAGAVGAAFFLILMSLWAQYAENQNRRVPTTSERDARPESDAAKTEADRRFWTARDGKTATYKQICDKPQDREYADLCQQWRVAEAAEWQLVAGALGIAGLLATILYTHRTFRLSAKTAERQLRAYVYLDPQEATYIPDKPLIFIGHLKNSGQTPAHRVGVASKVQAFSKRPTKLWLNAPRDVPRPTSVLNPGTHMNLIFRALPVVNSDIAMAIRREQMIICVWGVIQYDDIFGHTRETHFQFEFAGDESILAGQLRTSREGNDAT